jgi:phosphate acetyltransferase
VSVRIGLADAHDPRVAEAAARVAATGTAVPVLVGGSGVDLPTGAERSVPEEGVSDVDHLAGLVAEGRVAAGVGGSLTASAEVVRAGIRRLRGAGPRLVSGCFAIGRSGAWTTYADCVVVPSPDAAQLAEIAASAADHHRRTFGEEARVAMLSFSTAGSASHPRVRLVQEATQLLRESRPDLLVDGEVQFDVAVDPAVAARKAPSSHVAGAANVLVFPSLEAANIAYKVAERVGGATALGSFVLGLDRPWVDLSRGCSTDDIVATISLLARAAAAERAPDSIAG